MSLKVNECYETLKEIALGEGAALFGVAELEVRNPIDLSAKGVETRYELTRPELLGNLDRAVSIGVRLSRKVLETIDEGPNRLYSYHYRQVNMLLDQIALRISNFIQNEGYDALPVPASQIVDWKDYKGRVSHREIAKLAGLGWWGKNNLLVNPKYGSHVRYVSVLTDYPLSCDFPLEMDCGDCSACVSVCPGKAIGGTPADFDISKCAEAIREMSQKRNIGVRICGVCVKACKGRGENKWEK